MRRRLIIVATAISVMVAIAFLVPLIVLVRTVARDRAITNAEHDASAAAAVLVLEPDATRLASAIGSTDAGHDNRLTVILPSGEQVGAPVPRDDDLALAQSGTSFSASHAGGTAVFVASVGARGTSVVRVWVPDALLTEGVNRATVTLVVLALILVIGAIAVSDRLGASMVRPVRKLAGAAARLGDGDLTQRVEPEGPKEMVAVGQAFNVLAARVGELLAAERELVADLSHRLRTPLTVLRLEVDAVGDPPTRDRLRTAVVDLEDAVSALIAEARRPITAEMRTPCDLCAVARARVEFWSALADDQSRPVEADIANGAVIVSVPAVELEAALDALLGNVFEHTPDGTPFAVSVRATEGGEAVLTVDDAGAGVDPSRIERGQSGGRSTGLGLDIARRTVRAAGGDLSVSVSPLGGARIELVFPVVSH